MQPLNQCLEKVNQATNVYYFIVSYISENGSAEAKNLIYPAETLEFYRSLPLSSQAEIRFHAETIIDGKRYAAKTIKALSESDCERLIRDIQFHKELKSELRMAMASALMTSTLMPR